MRDQNPFYSAPRQVLVVLVPVTPWKRTTVSPTFPISTA